MLMTAIKKKNQIRVSVSEVLYQQIANRAGELGITMASYLRMLATQDLKSDGGEYDWKNYNVDKNDHTSKVIVINNDRVSTPMPTSRRKATTRSRNKTVSTKDILKYL